MIEDRKADHLKICANEEVGASWNNWDDIQLVHSSIPSCDLEQVDITMEFMGKKLLAPIIIAAMTGGHPKAEKVNKNLAKAAEEYGVGMGVGSQRAALENPKMEKTFSVIKSFQIPLVLGNIGAPQLLPSAGGYGQEQAKAAMEMIDAHALAVHFNYLQEVVQPEGETHGAWLMGYIKTLSRAVPVIAKETGAGISRTSALELKKNNVSAIDVGGSGGTSFAAVEVFRAREAGDARRERLGELLWDWGIPTPVSLREASVELPLMATGGIRSGLDVVKALALGANVVGVARYMLEPAMKGPKETTEALGALIEEIKSVLFLSGATSAKGAANLPWFVFEPTRTWLTSLGHPSTGNINTAAATMTQSTGSRLLKR